MIRKLLFSTAIILTTLMASAQSKIYMTREITPEALANIYKALGRPTDGNDNAPLFERINSRHGTHTIDHAAAIGLGYLDYEITDIDRQ